MTKFIEMENSSFQDLEAEKGNTVISMILFLKHLKEDLCGMKH